MMPSLADHKHLKGCMLDHLGAWDGRPPTTQDDENFRRLQHTQGISRQRQPADKDFGTHAAGTFTSQWRLAPVCPNPLSRLRQEEFAEIPMQRPVRPRQQSKQILSMLPAAASVYLVGWTPMLHTPGPITTNLSANYCSLSGVRPSTAIVSSLPP